MSKYSKPKSQLKEEEITREQKKDNQSLEKQDQLIDEAIDESFPASDPPGYRSKSQIDREEHQQNH